MKRCPITYEIIADEADYSIRGLRLLSPQLKHLDTLDLSAKEQRMEAIARVGKMSIQGVQNIITLIEGLLWQSGLNNLHQQI